MRPHSTLIERQLGASWLWPLLTWFNCIPGLKSQIRKGSQDLGTCQHLGGTRSRDARASAIAAGARRFFERLGVWGEVAAESQPILDMVITDSKLDDVELAAYTAAAGVIMNLDETITKE